ncbi:hypothetical protein PUN28_001037 [Cardiocondyla obscurior]|uniref:AB hydrolase-1 domain-containing protein n=1 Tax=Cardiocondyla obscurior TaxID=286306 RepID=A0AAW2H2M2_9HYME
MTEVEKFKEIKLPVPWGYIAGKTYGSSDGKAVLVVHGWLDNSGSFTRLMKYLPKELFYYVCIDLPGHGWSSSFPSWMIIDVMDYAHTIHFILEALQWKTCIYIGHSMGAQVGLLFSTLHPHRIEKLISFDGVLMNFLDRGFVSYFKVASAASKKACQAEETQSFTKDEMLHAFKNLRVSSLNSEAAHAIYERAVTKVNDKYIYNRDVRLKNNPFSLLNMNDCQDFNNILSIPIYLFVPSHGIIVFNDVLGELVLKTMRAKTMLKIIYVDGNHDTHNNNPEKVAPFICRILNNNNISKL